MARGFSRRTFVCGGCALLTTGCPPAGEPSKAGDPTGDTATTPPGDTAPPAEVYPCGQQVPTGPSRIELPLASYPDLADVGGWYAVPSSAGELVVAHVVEGCYVAIERACAHEGVPIDYSPSRGQFTCPRHGAVYGLQGEKVSGPQAGGLPVYTVAREQDSIWIDVDAPAPL
ncbi:MAG TPA: Rieske (2Fe-2S) protein [Deltaproteobacteria bacterium]|nr:Rieske (2Fe-2S) protein [Deltaproteobacteria bacterium]